jgi:hypothetical protein
MVVKEDGKKSALRLPFRVDACPEFLEELKKLLGEECVKVQ